MNKLEILSKAIDKAINNGYKPDMLSQHIQRIFRNSTEAQLLDKYLTIFTHNFAKAFWGEEIVDQYNEWRAWQYHLRQMVLEENPIEYLSKFV